jgi:hypothetical protein
MNSKSIEASTLPVLCTMNLNDIILKKNIFEIPFDTVYQDTYFCKKNSD